VELIVGSAKSNHAEHEKIRRRQRIEMGPKMPWDISSRAYNPTRLNGRRNGMVDKRADLAKSLSSLCHWIESGRSDKGITPWNEDQGRESGSLLCFFLRTISWHIRDIH